MGGEGGSTELGQGGEAQGAEGEDKGDTAAAGVSGGRNQGREEAQQKGEVKQRPESVSQPGWLVGWRSASAEESTLFRLRYWLDRPKGVLPKVDKAFIFKALSWRYAVI